jgi:ribonuclease-3
MKVNFNRIFFFFSKKKDPYENKLSQFLLKKLSYNAKDISLFVDAFTHKSFSNTLQNTSDNERLEYLGDTVIDLIVAQYLYDKFPKEDEGYLTKVKAKIVNRKMLSFIGAELKLADVIRYRQGRSIQLSTLEGNAFEALIGAIFLDSNYETTKQVFEQKILKRYVNFKDVLAQEMDFKSQLLIWGQKNKLGIIFEIKDPATKENGLVYTAIVIINNKEWGMGKGTSKKEAEQQASSETMTLLGLH